MLVLCSLVSCTPSRCQPAHTFSWPFTYLFRQDLAAPPSDVSMMLLSQQRWRKMAKVWKSMVQCTDMCPITDACLLCASWFVDVCCIVGALTRCFFAIVTWSPSATALTWRPAAFAMRGIVNGEGPSSNKQMPRCRCP
jgi:hypothetical protein